MDYVCDFTDSVLSILRDCLSHDSSDMKITTALKYDIILLCWLYRSANARWTAFSVETSRSEMDNTDCRTLVTCCGDRTKARPWRTFIQKGRDNCQANRSLEHPNLCDGLMAAAWSSLACFLCRQVPRHLRMSCFSTSGGAVFPSVANSESKPRSHDTLVAILCMWNTVLRAWQTACQANSYQLNGGTSQYELRWSFSSFVTSIPAIAHASGEQSSKAAKLAE